jgi:hypothetical protein
MNFQTSVLAKFDSARTTMYVHVRLWHLADIPPRPLFGRFRGEADKYERQP